MSLIGKDNTKAMLNVITKLANHEYSKIDALTIDDIEWYSWPAAVLNTHKEDLLAYQNTISETVQACEPLPLVQNITLDPAGA